MECGGCFSSLLDLDTGAATLHLLCIWAMFPRCPLLSDYSSGTGAVDVSMLRRPLLLLCCCDPIRTEVVRLIGNRGADDGRCASFVGCFERTGV